MNLYGNQEDVKAFAGMLYGMNPETIVSKPAKSDIAFGVGVELNSDGTVQKMEGAGSKFYGVSVFHQCEGGKYYAKDSVAVLTDGYIWMEISDGISSITLGAVAYVLPLTGIAQTDSSSAIEIGTFESDVVTIGNKKIALVHVK